MIFTFKRMNFQQIQSQHCICRGLIMWFVNVLGAPWDGGVGDTARDCRPYPWLSPELCEQGLLPARERALAAAARPAAAAAAAAAQHLQWRYNITPMTPDWLAIMP